MRDAYRVFPYLWRGLDTHITRRQVSLFSAHHTSEKTWTMLAAVRATSRATGQEAGPWTSLSYDLEFREFRLWGFGIDGSVSTDEQDESRKGAPATA